MGEIAEMYREWDADEAWDSYRADNRRARAERKLLLLERAEQGIWTQRDGTPIAIKDITDSHLLAAARLLRREGFIGPRALAAYLGPGPTADGASLAFKQEQGQAFDAPVSPFVDLFDDEIKRRGLQKGGS
jgi:hypothetical protein